MHKRMPFNFKRKDQAYLISNMTRDFIELNEGEFEQFYNDSVVDIELREKLIENRFLCETEEQFDSIVKTYQSFNSGLFKGTFLHIFVLTLECNLNCLYCQAESNDKGTFMTEEIAEKAVDIALQSIDKELTFEFQGGEPLANFKVLKHIVEYTNANKGEKVIHYTMVSNAGLMTNEILQFLVENNVSICISIDGPKELHDKNRPAKNSTPNFECAMQWFDEAKLQYAKLGREEKVSALSTITRYTLENYKDFVDFYIKLGARSISIRELSPYGRASSNWGEISYTYKEFLEFYTKCMDYLIELNINGKTNTFESYTDMYLKMIVGKNSINYTDLRSPCGAAIAQMAYNWNGNIYTCDEGRMMANSGVEDFKIGNVFESSYKDCIQSDASKYVCSASCIESNPDCMYCVFNCICGVCPVYSNFVQGNLIGQTYKQDRCRILKGKYEYLIDQLLNGDTETRNLLSQLGK